MSSKPDQQPPQDDDSPKVDAKQPLGLTPDLTELVIELKETVKRLDPKKHNPKTLRRSLSVVGDILADIDRLTSSNNKGMA